MARALSQVQRAVLSAVQGGAQLCAEKTEDGEEHFFLSDGRTVGQTTIAALKRRNLIQRRYDGLLGDGQTFALVDREAAE